MLHTQHLRSFLKHCGPALLGMCHQRSLRGGAKTPRFSKHSRVSSAQWHSLLLKTLETSSAVADTASSLLMRPDRPHNRSPLLPPSSTITIQCFSVRQPCLHLAGPQKRVLDPGTRLFLLFFISVCFSAMWSLIIYHCPMGRKHTHEAKTYDLDMKMT